MSGKTATEAFNLLKRPLARVFALFKEFKEGRESVDDERGKHAKETIRTEANIKIVEFLVKEDRQTMMHEGAMESSPSLREINIILYDDLGLSKKAARWATINFMAKNTLKSLTTPLIVQILPHVISGYSLSFKLLGHPVTQSRRSKLLY